MYTYIHTCIHTSDYAPGSCATSHKAQCQYAPGYRSSYIYTHTYIYIHTCIHTSDCAPGSRTTSATFDEAQCQYAPGYRCPPAHSPFRRICRHFQVYIYIHTYMHACIYMLLHTLTPVQIHTYIHTYMHACIYMLLHTLAPVDHVSQRDSFPFKSSQHTYIQSNISYTYIHTAPLHSWSSR